MSEGATSITWKIQYNSKTDSLIGFASILDETGILVQHKFPTNSASQTQKYFIECDRDMLMPYSTAPVDDNPLLCLNVFGTNNRFTLENALKRWQYLESQVFKHGITVLGFSSDGDPSSPK